MRIKSKHLQWMSAQKSKHMQSQHELDSEADEEHKNEEKVATMDIATEQDAKDYNTEDVEVKKIKSILHRVRRSKHRNGRHHHHAVMTAADWRQQTESKFFTKLPVKLRAKSAFRAEAAPTKSVTLSHYFGYKYYYWDEYKHCMDDDDGANTGYKKRDWYIFRKYESLKDEMVNNRICCVSMNLMHNALTKADKHMQCRFARKLHSRDSRLAEFCRTRAHCRIAVENVMAIILYCDYFDLAHHFKSTFRKINEIETHQQIKQRNREYWWWSKILAETVQLYGKRVCKSKQTLVCFHGVSQLNFPVFVSYFSAPTSATPFLQVALQSAVAHNMSDGVLLDLVAENEYSDLRAFDCSWLSCYANEGEQVFFGNCRPLKINNIREMATNLNYGVYIKAMTLFSYVIHATELTEFTKSQITYSDYHIISCLMRHVDKYRKYKNSFPKYINQLFGAFCASQKSMYLSLAMLHSDYPGFASFLLSERVANLVCIDYVVRIFQSLKELTIYGINDLSDDYILALIAMLEQLIGMGSLIKLKLHAVRYEHECLDSHFLAKYSIQFRLQAGCKISVDIKDRLVFNEATKAWTKHIEQTDLIIIRNSVLSLKQSHSHQIRRNPKNFKSDRNGNGNGMLMVHHAVMSSATTSDTDGFGKYLVHAAVTSDETDLFSPSEHTQDTLTSSRQHAGMLHKNVTL